MPITVTCDECSEPHRVRDDAVGRQFVCKGCGKSLTVKAPASDSQEVSRVDAAESLGDVTDKAGDPEFDLHRFLTETVPADLRLQRELPPKASSLIQRIDKLIGCVILLVVSSSLIVWLPIMIYRDQSPRDPFENFFVWVIAPILWLMGLGGVKLSFRLFRFLIFGAESLSEIADPSTPTYSDEALVCRDFGWLGKPVRIIVDRAAGQIHFQNCHTPRKFFAVKSQPWFSCPLADIRDAYRSRKTNRGGTTEWVTIITRDGTAHLRPSASNYASMCVTISDLIPVGLRTSSEKVPVEMHLCIFGGLGGVLLAFFLLPLRGSPEVMILYVAAGAVTGGGVAYLLGLLVRRK